jgi:ligand-binding sensor domain-containing protein/anti-sigma regulatory factor (Ser/Thr protein kinase)
LTVGARSRNVVEARQLPGATFPQASMLLRFLPSGFVIGVLSAALPAAPLSGQDRLMRMFGPEHGLQVPTITALAQDSAGYLWVGGEGGLYRFDGSEMRRWAGDVIAGSIAGVSVAPTGSVVAMTWDGAVYALTPTGAQPISPPAMARPGHARAMIHDRDGVLWVVSGDSAAYLEPSLTAWHWLSRATTGHEAARRVVRDADVGVLVVTDGGLWRVTRNGEATRLLTMPGIVDAVARDGRSILLLLNTPNPHVPRVVELVDGIATDRRIHGAVPGARAIGLVERAGTVWLSLDRYLIALRDGERAEVLGWEHGIESGGPLLIDREGSLWLGTYSGLIQFPEPETRTWTEREGLPTRHVRFLARSGNSVWVFTWAGTGHLQRSAEGVRVTDPQVAARGITCGADMGVAWALESGPLLALLDSVVTRLAMPYRAQLHGCARALDGGVWLGSATDLFHVDPARSRVRTLPGPLPGQGSPHPALLHDQHDRVWVGAGDNICHAPARRLLDGDGDQWTCVPVAGLGNVRTIVELPEGGLWAASDRLGILSYDDGAWLPLPMADSPTRRVFALQPSPRGGLWVVGVGILRRVAPSRSGWTVLEELSAWHGVAVTGGGDLLEDDDGTLWIATARGVIRVPAAVRTARRSAPLVALVGASVDERAVHAGSMPKLRQGRNRLDLDFAALSFRDPTAVRHQIRVRPDKPWSESRGRPAFRLVDLGPGTHSVEYRASLDGVEWSAAPIHVGFEVQPHWYRTWWFVTLSLLITAALGWGVHRARVGFLLRLERQRTRIALDLHDEVGSGLASVGILSGVLASDVLDAGERRHAAAEIATAAEELGHALSDIVWSLDARAATLSDLASRLAEHGGRLFADGDTALVTCFPDRWPTGQADVAVRRNVLLIGLEALHNAARHARARTVVLSLVQHGTEWELCVRDDGAGIDPDGLPAATASRVNGARRGTGSGHGLPGMRRRAAEIGARLDVRSGSDGGTIICLQFSLTQSPRTLDRLVRFAGL